MVLILRLGDKRAGKMIAPAAMELSGLKKIGGSVSSREEEEKVKKYELQSLFIVHCLLKGERECDVTVTLPKNVMMNVGKSRGGLKNVPWEGTITL